MSSASLPALVLVFVTCIFVGSFFDISMFGEDTKIEYNHHNMDLIPPIDCCGNTTRAYWSQERKYYRECSKEAKQKYPREGVTYAPEELKEYGRVADRVIQCTSRGLGIVDESGYVKVDEFREVVATWFVQPELKKMALELVPICVENANKLATEQMQKDPTDSNFAPPVSSDCVYYGVAQKCPEELKWKTTFCNNFVPAAPIYKDELFKKLWATV